MAVRPALALRRAKDSLGDISAARHRSLSGGSRGRPHGPGLAITGPSWQPGDSVREAEDCKATCGQDTGTVSMAGKEVVLLSASSSWASPYDVKYQSGVVYLKQFQAYKTMQKADPATDSEILW